MEEGNWKHEDFNDRIEQINQGFFMSLFVFFFKNQEMTMHHNR